jgi:hypothetical protein
MANISDFQKSFLARGTNSTLFTQKEFDEALAVAQAQIMQIAIDTTKTAISIEREECAKVCEQFEPESFYLGQVKNAAEAIRNRLKK